jgi:hypothetical protein
MPKFGKSSKARLATCDERLQKVFNEVIKHVDCSILEGHRNEQRQNELYDQGKSKLRYPSGKHNSLPSKAVDAVPYPIDWQDIERMRAFAFFVKGVAASMGINLRLGADWDGDFTCKDQSFHDLPHFEIKD